MRTVATGVRTIDDAKTRLAAALRGVWVAMRRAWTPHVHTLPKAGLSDRVTIGGLAFPLDAVHVDCTRKAAA